MLALTVLLAATLGMSTDAVAQEKGRRGARTASTKAVVSENKAPVKPMSPSGFVEERVTRILRDLKGRAPRLRTPEGAVKIEVPVAISKARWLQAVYSKQLVDSSRATGLLSDKLLFYETVKREIGEEATLRYLVRTVGLRDFLVKGGYVDAQGRLVSDGDKIEAGLFKAFPAGFVARPAVGVAPRETGRGLFKETDAFVSELLKPGTFLYRPEHRRKPVRSTVLDDIASGEAIVLQEDVIASAKVTGGVQAGERVGWREVRVHSYEGRVLEDASPNFWVRSGRVSSEETLAAQKFVTDFLALLPSSVLSRQAFSFDVLILPEGGLRIADFVTNRGRRTAWSGYLDQPRVIGAYTRHFEQYAGVEFAGMGGIFLRKNAGNYFGYWGMRIERSRPGFEKVLAYIPPWP
jgi:hypothetical protein